MSFFPTFSSGAIEPAQVSYTAITIASNTTLAWPDLDSTGTFVANIIEVTPSAGSLSVTMPDATQRSVGQQVLFRNMTGTAFTVKDNSGGTIANIPANIAIYIYLINNSTAAGSWSLVTFGAGTSSADSATLAGAGLKAIGITLNQKHDVLETSSNVTIDSTYRAKTVVWTTGTLAATLPTAASAGADFFFIMKNAGGGTITLTPTGGDTVDGAASIAFAPNDAAMVFSAGSANHWYTVGLGRSVSFSFTQLVKNVAGGVDVTLTSSECANKVMTFTGLLTANINVIVTNTVSVYYVFNNTTGAFSLTVKTAAGGGSAVVQGTHDIVVCDATNVARAVTNTAATTAFSAGSVSSPSITFTGDTDTGIYSPSANQVGITAGGVAMGFFGATSTNLSPAFTGQSGAKVVIRNPGESIEFGHNNPAGYGSTIGAQSSNGNPFLALCAVAGTTINTYKTLGLKGTVITTDLNGSILFHQISNTNADNQSPTGMAQMTTAFFAPQVNLGMDLGGTGSRWANVFTSAVDTGAAVDLAIKRNGVSQLSVVSGGLLPAVDNAVSLGTSSFRFSQLFTPIIDSGTVGSLSLRTNNGTEQLRVIHTTTAVNYGFVVGGAAGTDPAIGSQGTDAALGLRITGGGTGNINFYTDNTANLQFQIIRTASATRNITITGSNGGNPTINTTAGNLAITPTVIVTSGIIDTGSTGALSLKTNNGAEQLRIVHTASTTNLVTVTGGNAANPTVSVTGSSTNIGVKFFSKGTGGFDFVTANDNFSGAGTPFTFSVQDTGSGTGESDGIIVKAGSVLTGGPIIDTTNNGVSQLRLTSGGASAAVTIVGGTNPTVGTSSGDLVINPSGDTQWGKALIALGGGATATMGTIGGSGPATAAQNKWARFKDSTGAAMWIPIWK